MATEKFSITYLARGHYHATPIYDVFSAHPVIGKVKNKIPLQKAKLAMAVRECANYYLIEKIQRRHWISQAQQVGLGAEAAEQLIEEIIESTDAVINEVSKLLPDNFPMDLAEAIFGGMKKHCAKLATIHS